MAKCNMLRRDWGATPRWVFRAPARELDINGLARITVGLEVARDVERVVREGPRRNDQVADRDIALRGGGADADGKQWYLRLACGFDSRGGIDARVLSAISNNDNT